MKYGQVKGIDKKISRLVQGTIMLKAADQEAGFALLDTAFERGCNTFDGAHLYGGGQCERLMGQWMEARGNRDEVVIISKAAHHNADRKRVTPFDITADLHDSLARLRTDYIDLYLLHRDDPDVSVIPIVEILDQHRQAGRIRAFGGSNWSHERIQRANVYANVKGMAPFVASSPNFSLADQLEAPWPGCLSISGPQGAEARAWYSEQEMPLFTWSSLAGGFFSGRLSRDNAAEFGESFVNAYCHQANFQRLDRVRELAAEKGKTVAQIALAYVLHQSLDIFPLVGSASPEEFNANYEALDIQLTPAEMEWLDLRRQSR
jgi:aryl-alcohol dehydrogenase-like predicted oxidoreductase